MSFNVAYSNKDKIKNSVAQGIIPEESFIITNNEEKDESETEARTWMAKYGNYEGETISIKDANGNWNSYNVGANGEMNQVPNTESLTDILDGLIIDGGRAPTA